MTVDNAGFSTHLRLRCSSVVNEVTQSFNVRQMRFVENNTVVKKITRKKLSLIEARGQTDALSRYHAHTTDFAAAAGLGRTTPYASPRYRTAVDVIIKT